MNALALDWPGVGNWNYAGSWFGDFPPLEHPDNEDDEEDDE